MTATIIWFALTTGATAGLSNYKDKKSIHPYAKGPWMAREIVKVYLGPEQKKVLEIICRSLGMDESEILRVAFMDYAKSISLITEKCMANYDQPVLCHIG